MSGFAADWLALREGFDAAARAPGDAALAGLLRSAGPLRVLDLGCGTGASLRALAPRLGPRQHWRLVDHDGALLAAVPQALRAWAAAQGLRLERRDGGLLLHGPAQSITVELVRADLATGLAALAFAEAGLVTASALLDLVSHDWLAALVAQCRAAGAAICWALSVDGRVQFDPPDADDAWVLACFAADQRRDKGLGPALGPQAPQRAAALLQQAGYQVAQCGSDWAVDGARGADHLRLLQAMLDGIAQAAAAQAPAAPARVEAWKQRRLQALAHSRLLVGHADLWAAGPGRLNPPA